MSGVFDLNYQHDDVDSKLTAGFERLSQALRVMLWDEAKREGLSPIQVQTLVQLKYHGVEERRVSALAARFDLTKPTVSDAVKALEAKGLVKRTVDSQDARAFILELTEAGAEVTHKVERWAERTRAALANLDSEAKQDTLLLVMSLIETLQGMGVITVARMCKTCRFLRVDSQGDTPYYCALLEQPLHRGSLRVDCPEHKAA